MAAGVVLGLATGLFLRSKRGEEMTEEIEEKLKLLEQQIVARLKGAEELTQEVYDEVVDEVLETYGKGRARVKAELPGLRRELRKRWKIVKAFVDDRI